MNPRVAIEPVGKMFLTKNSIDFVTPCFIWIIVLRAFFTQEIIVAVQVAINDRNGVY